MLIINADDFGMDEQTNAAIVYCFENGLCSSTTIMPNRPGFEQACELAHQKKLLNHVGLHLVLTEGYPLTEGIRRQERFCDIRGQFTLGRTKRIFHLSTVERQALTAEIRAQITKCRDFGLPLTHVDSHHHTHEEIGVVLSMTQLIREFDIPYIRIMCNTARYCSIQRRAYTMSYNSYLKYHGLNKTDYFGSIDQYVEFMKGHSAENAVGTSFEIMTHPIVNSEGVIADALNKKPMKQLIEDAGLCHKGKSFSGTAYRS